jgi:hypothetical protein
MRGKPKDEGAPSPPSPGYYQHRRHEGSATSELFVHPWSGHEWHLRVSLQQRDPLLAISIQHPLTLDEARALRDAIAQAIQDKENET